MRRTSLALAAIGGAAVLAVTGAAVGLTTAGGSGPATVPAAVTSDDGPETAGATPDDNPGGADDSPGPDDSATTGAARPGAAPDTPGPNGAVDRRQAGTVALTRLGGGRIVEVEAETEHGRPVWSVKVARDGLTWEVKVDRADGAVVEVERRAAGARHAADGRRGDDRYDDHGGDRVRSDDRYDDHGGDRVGDDDGDRYDDHGGDRPGDDD
ncbi:PepSY domain-containing protein [Micromonospora chersina]|uniref:PepSY domain-containing protein n=1 Tax=Micromonospora chersina TaxID=47854 RepID=UPI003718C57E